MRVAELMTTAVVTIRGDAPVSDAVALLADSRIGGLAVVDHHRQLAGTVSASDILAAEAEAGDDEARAAARSSVPVARRFGDADAIEWL